MIYKTPFWIFTFLSAIIIDYLSKLTRSNPFVFKKEIEESKTVFCFERAVKDNSGF